MVIQDLKNNGGPKHKIQMVANLDINYHPQGKYLNDSQPEYQLSNEWIPP